MWNLMPQSRTGDPMPAASLGCSRSLSRGHGGRYRAPWSPPSVPVMEPLNQKVLKCGDRTQVPVWPLEVHPWWGLIASCSGDGVIRFCLGHWVPSLLDSDSLLCPQVWPPWGWALTICSWLPLVPDPPVPSWNRPCLGWQCGHVGGRLGSGGVCCAGPSS